MVIELALVAAGFLLTVTLGAPVASRAATHRGGWAWLRGSPSAPEARPRQEATRAFQPLDLGPDPIQWPSQRPWPASPLAAQPWPSETWNDEHFGVQRRQAAEAPARPAEPAERPKAPEPPAEAPTQAPAKSSKRRARQATERPAPPAADREPQPPRPRPAPTAATPPAAPPEAAPGVPTREELEGLVETVGLAGTVQRIMERTGWDFRQAAQYLARVRQGK